MYRKEWHNFKQKLGSRNVVSNHKRTLLVNEAKNSDEFLARYTEVLTHNAWTFTCIRHDAINLHRPCRDSMRQWRRPATRRNTQSTDSQTTSSDSETARSRPLDFRGSQLRPLEAIRRCTECQSYNLWIVNDHVIQWIQWRKRIKIYYRTN